MEAYIEFKDVVKRFDSFLGRMIRYWVRVGEELFVIDDAGVDLTGAKAGRVRLCLEAKKLHILRGGGSDAAS